jgi:Mn2+/Fe2+ NRAMP family transporter
VLAATAIGASHLVLAPTAGAAFGYALLWVMPFSHLIKYPAFEFGPRFAAATGTSLLDGYARVPGPRGWALAVFLLGTVVQGVTVLAGVLGVAAAVAVAVFPALPLPVWSMVLGLVIAALLASGGFDALSALCKWMLLGLTIMTVLAFVARPPGPGFLEGLLRPRIPRESVILLAALLGWMPTGIDVAVWHSMWSLERRDEWIRRGARSERAGTSDAARAFATGRLDLWIGYGLSLVLSILFLALGAEVLRPAGLIPQGADVAITMARLYTDSLGAWVLPLFMIAAFFGMFSTAYGVLDGFPRAFARTVVRLSGGRGGAASRVGAPVGPDPWVGRRTMRAYWGFLFSSLALALAETVWIPDPVVLVTVAAFVSFLLAPVLYALNHYCVTKLIDEPDLRPGPGMRAWSWLGMLGMGGAAAFFLWVQFAR